jgi:CHAT domain/Lecithin:cholesterol acyltransferase
MATRRSRNNNTRSAEPSGPITFVLRSAADATQAPGAATRGAASAALPAGLVRGELRHSLQLSATRAAGTQTEQRVVAEPGRDVVVLRIAGGPALVLHPEHARDLMRAQQGPQGAPARSRSQVQRSDDTVVPTELRWQGLELPSQGDGASRGAVTRGLLGSVLLAGLDIVRDPGGSSMAEMAADRVAARVDAQVQPGVYALDAAALTKLKDSGRAPLAALPAADGPLLVFIHGSFSNTASGFSKLWQQHPQRVASLFTHYGNRVYALDHPTLTASPIANALLLAQALPQGARLHLLTHSRGGLVAEVLARTAANPELKGEKLGDFTAAEQRDLKALGTLLADKQVRVERVVRVACPARGTLLASKRLDAYLSVFKWTLELGGVPVLPELVDFLSAVAQRRADPEQLPGLAAQIPGSALIQWLHAADSALPGQLRVIAGDVQGDSVGSWLKTLLADSFYWTDNDFVVQTRSMYGGAPRAGGALFLLDRGARIAHNSYFAAERTAEAVCTALMQEQPAGFAVIGPLSWAGEDSSGTRGARRTRGADDGRPASEKPAVILLPGICGSHLAVNGQRIWLSFRLVNGLKRLAYPEAQGVTADGAIGPIYDDLAEHLATTHEVIEFSYDWRKPVEEEARRLAQVAEAALSAREGSGQPVRFVAHSLGGLVVRTLQLEAPDLFERLMARAGARVLMLGTPNGGSWAPMQVLSGDDTFGNTLVALGAPFQDASARALMAAMPGFLQLQASLTDASQGLADAATWKDLAERDLAAVREHNWWHNDEAQLNAYTWGVPPQAVLDQALHLRERLDEQRDKTLSRFADKVLLVVGRAKFTPDGFSFDDNEGLSYLNAVEAGDGRVTRASARLPGVRTWGVDCEHGKLPDHESAFDAYVELLGSGNTTALTRQPDMPAGTRGTGANSNGAGAVEKRASARYVKSRPSREASAPRPPERETEIGTLTAAPIERAARNDDLPALEITVLNGNLMFIRQPLLVGHYRGSQLTGSEGVVDNLIGGAMTASLGAGVYPDGSGAFQMFRNARSSDNPLQMPRPEWAIVVGLGDETELTPTTLKHSARQSIIGWAQRIVEQGNAAATFELASTLIGSGGTRMSPNQSAQVIAQAAREANVRLKASGWPLLAHLWFVELYLDRASDAWRSLQVLATTRPADWRIAEHVRSGAGALRRPLDTGYRSADYDLISATSVQTHVEGRGFDTAIAYSLDTKRARTEVRAQATQAKLVREIVKRASNDRNQDPQIGRTLYQLLVPVEMDPFLGGTTEARIEVDGGTAGIPWELLHDTHGDGGGESLPWSIRTKLIRKLRTTRFRQTVSDAGINSDVLVIGEPAVTEADPQATGRPELAGSPSGGRPPQSGSLGGKQYPRLPGARREAKAVVTLLTATGAFDNDDVRALIAEADASTAPDAHRVINALLERDWRIVHIAGHGEPPERITRSDGSSADGDPRGVVLSHGCYLGPREIRTMRTVPELVFINCCYLAEHNSEQLLREDDLFGYDRAQFASSVAEELIKLGVRCVVVAGWAVEDTPAEIFATTFYGALLSGARFIDAAARARQAAWEVRDQGNTWAAYQCYGDPDWTLRRDKRERRITPPAEKFAGISSPVGLAIALETVAVETRFLRADERERRIGGQRERLAYLEARFGPAWGGMGAVAEAFALAYSEAGETVRAIAWYARAMAANDGSATQRAAEQWANLAARQAQNTVREAAKARDAIERKVRRDGKVTPQERVLLQAAERAVREAALAAREPLREARATIERLIALQPTMERASLAGSACKRMAMVEAEAGSAAEALASVQQMKLHYARAEAMAGETDSPERYYPALNRMAAELVIDAGKPGWRGFDVAATAFVRQSLAERTREDPDFWSVAGLTELRVYEAVAALSLAAASAAIQREYDELHRRVSGTHYWRSVHDTSRFVLDTYAQRATAAEQKASAALVALLEGFAWPT